jgi:preprotein translocase SecE subunit
MPNNGLNTHNLMASIGQYLKDTQGELRHVAWPTQVQTIVYTVLVALISVGVALYLGLFDYLFTTSLAKAVSSAPAQSAQQTQTATPTQPTSTSPANPVDFSIPGGSTNK